MKDPAETLKRACGNLADSDLVSVPRWAAMAGALAIEDSEGAEDREAEAVKEALAEANSGFDAEQEEQKQRHWAVVDELRVQIAKLKEALAVLS